MTIQPASSFTHTAEQTYNSFGLCPLSRNSFQNEIGARSNVDLPYIFAFAVQHQSYPPIAYDAVTWIAHHKLHPNFFFRNGGYQKVYFCALDTLMQTNHRLQYIGAVGRMCPKISGYLWHYILATACTPLSYDHIECLLSDYRNCLDLRTVLQFATSLLRHDPANSIATNTLLNYIRFASANFLARQRAQVIATIACRLDNFALFRAILEQLARRPQTYHIRMSMASILAKWNQHAPGNPTILSLLGFALSNTNAANFDAGKTFLLEAQNIAPRFPLSYFIMAKLYFQNMLSASSNLDLAKIYLGKFLQLSLANDIPGDDQHLYSRLACDLIRAHSLYMSEENLLTFSEMILTALPDFAEAYNLVPEYQEEAQQEEAQQLEPQAQLYINRK